MAIIIGSNVRAQQLSRLLDASTRDVQRATTNLSSGQRINRASDDAAGLAVSSTLDVKDRVYGQAVRNVNDGISFLQIATTALRELETITERQLELVQQSTNGILGTAQRRALNEEARQLTDEYKRIIASTRYNGTNVFSTDKAGRVVIQAGAGEAESLTLELGKCLSSGGTEAQTVVSGVDKSFSSGTAESVQLNFNGMENVAEFDFSGITPGSIEDNPGATEQTSFNFWDGSYCLSEIVSDGSMEFTVQGAYGSQSFYLTMEQPGTPERAGFSFSDAASYINDLQNSIAAGFTVEGSNGSVGFHLEVQMNGGTSNQEYHAANGSTILENIFSNGGENFFITGTNTTVEFYFHVDGTHGSGSGIPVYISSSDSAEQVAQNVYDTIIGQAGFGGYQVDGISGDTVYYSFNFDPYILGAGSGGGITIQIHEGDAASNVANSVFSAISSYGGGTGYNASYDTEMGGCTVTVEAVNSGDISDSGAYGAIGVSITNGTSASFIGTGSGAAIQLSTSYSDYDVGAAVMAAIGPFSGANGYTVWLNGDGTVGVISEIPGNFSDSSGDSAIQISISQGTAPSQVINYGSITPGSYFTIGQDRFYFEIDGNHGTFQPGGRDHVVQIGVTASIEEITSLAHLAVQGIYTSSINNGQSFTVTSNGDPFTISAPVPGIDTSLGIDFFSGSSSSDQLLSIVAEGTTYGFSFGGPSVGYLDPGVLTGMQTAAAKATGTANAINSLLGASFTASASNGVLTIVNDVIGNQNDGAGIMGMTGASFTKTDGTPVQISSASDYITIPSHGLTEGQRVRLSTAGTLPGGLATATDYYVHVLNANSIQLDTTAAYAPPAVNILNNGTGIHTLTAYTETVIPATPFNLMPDTLDLTSIAGSKAGMDSLQARLERISQEISNAGVFQSRLEVAIASLCDRRDQYKAASARIKDADIAVESASMMAASIRQQTAANLMHNLSADAELVRMLI